MSANQTLPANFYIDTVNALAAKLVSEKKLTTTSAAAAEVFRTINAQTIDVTLEMLNEVGAAELFKQWAGSVLTNHLLGTRPEYSKLVYDGPVGIDTPATVPAPVDTTVPAPVDTTVLAPVVDEDKKDKMSPAASPAPLLTPSSKKSWADVSKEADLEEQESESKRQKLIEALPWSKRMGAKNLSLEEVEALLAAEKAKAASPPTTPVKKDTPVLCPDAPKKLSVTAAAFRPSMTGSPKQLQFDEDVKVAPVRVSVAEPGWVITGRKSKITQLGTAKGKQAMFSEAECAESLGTPNKQKGREGTVTSLKWWAAFLAGMVALLPKKYDWFLHGVDAAGNPIGWEVLDRDVAGNPIAWRANKASRFIHKKVALKDGSFQIQHFELIEVEDRNGDWSERLEHVSTEYVIWTICPQPLRHKLGKCPKA
jgi:hypothetical protein